jgi:hypothetical protein
MPRGGNRGRCSSARVRHPNHLISRTDSAALIAAVSRDDIDAARALLDAGTSPELHHGKFQTPLLGLARSAQMLRLLLHGADPNARASNGRFGLPDLTN